MQTAGGIVDIPVKKDAVIGIEQDLSDRRAGAFRHHAIDHAFAFRHPGARKPHLNRLQNLRLFYETSYTNFAKSKETLFIHLSLVANTLAYTCNQRLSVS